MAEEQAVSATLTAAATQDEGAVAIGAVTATGTIQAGQQTATPTKVVVAILPTDTPIPTDTPTTTPTTTPVPVGQTPVDGTNDEPAGVPTDTPTDTPTSMSTSTPTSTYTPAPTNTPTKIVAVTQTPVPPAVTDTPTVTPTTTPTATPTKIVAAPAPIDGGASDLVFSTDPINGGRNILLPGFSPSEIGNPMIFRDRISLVLSIYAANASEQVAGAGVRQVEFVVTDLETGDTVHEQVESTSLYCLFGGNTLEECRAKTFAEMGYQWPNGKAIYNGEYRVDMFIETENDNGDWNISFFIEGAQDRPTEGEPEETDANFSGRWQTNAGIIDFQQSGNQVSGTYQLYGDTQPYTMQGTVTGNILDGTYTGYDGGSISFGLSPDGERFDGSWFYQGQGEAFHWCGVRSGPLWDGCGYSGNWESIGDYVPNYQPTMRLVQNGSQIQGTFLNGVSNNPGTVAGQVGTDGVGSQLTAVGSWAIDSASGTFRWRLVNLQSNQIAGRSITADGQPHQWCSWRPGLAQPSPCLE